MSPRLANPAPTHRCEPSQARLAWDPQRRRRRRASAGTWRSQCRQICSCGTPAAFPSAVRHWSWPFFRARGLLIAPVAANHPPRVQKRTQWPQSNVWVRVQESCFAVAHCVPDCVALLELHVYCCACIALLPNCFAFAKVHQNYKTKPKAANKVQHMRSCTRKMCSTYCWVHKVQCIRYPQYKMLCKK